MQPPLGGDVVRGARGGSRVGGSMGWTFINISDHFVIIWFNCHFWLFSRHSYSFEGNYVGLPGTFGMCWDPMAYGRPVKLIKTRTLEQLHLRAWPWWLKPAAYAHGQARVASVTTRKPGS